MGVTIIAAADGSALGNPGPAGWGWYIDASCWAAGGWPRGTNNQGELVAVLDLLRQTAHTGEPLEVYCDSQYVINSLTKWLPGWKRKGWKKADGKPVLNREIMAALDAELAGRQVRFHWVKGHAGHELNERADALANSAAQSFQRREAPATGPGYPDARNAAGAGPDPVDAAAPGTHPSGPAPSAPAAAALDDDRTGEPTNLLDAASHEHPEVAAVLACRTRTAQLLHPDFRSLGGGRPARAGSAGGGVAQAWSPAAGTVLVARMDGALEVWVPMPAEEQGPDGDPGWLLAAIAGRTAR